MLVLVLLFVADALLLAYFLGLWRDSMRLLREVIARRRLVQSLDAIEEQARRN